MGKLNEICEVDIIYKRPAITTMPKIVGSSDMVDVFRELIPKGQIDFKEFFLVALLSRNNNVLGVAQISVGTTTHTFVNIKEILQLVIKTNSSAIIVCHNHPSGNLTVSDSDKLVTKKIKEACSVIEITLLDHIILTSEGYFSVADNLGI